MALNKTEFYAETTRAALPRIQPAEGPGAVMTRQFAADAGGSAVTLPVGLPLFLEATTGLLKKVVPGSGTAEQKQIYAFVWPVPVVIKATGGGEVLGSVMVKGSMHFADLEAMRAAGTLAGTAQQLEDVARDPITRERDLVIEGINLQGGNSGL